VSKHQQHLVLLLVAIAGVGTLFWYGSRPEPIAVLATAAEMGVVEQTVANTRAGTVKACRRARLSPSTGGQIAMLDIHEGDKVKAGQLLLALWNKDLTAEIDLKEEEAKAAKANSRAICLQADEAQRESNRLAKLKQRGVVSVESIDKASTNAKFQRANCESAQVSAKVSIARVWVSRAQLERTQLFAPFDGVVAEINGEISEYVTPSPPGIPTPPAVDLIDNSCFYITAPIDEVDAPKVKLGQPARITLDAFGEQQFPGLVRRVAPYVLDMEKQARTVEVEVEFIRKEDIEQLLAGYSADVEIILEAHQNTVRIPAEAVLEGGRVLRYLPDDGVLKEVKIQSGLSNWDYTEVVTGLKPGDQVVTSIDRKGVEDGAEVILDTEQQP